MGQCYNKAMKINEIRSDMTKRCYVSISFGKDSVAMTEEGLRLNKEARLKGLPEPYPMHEGVFADTLFEFPYMYGYIKSVCERWKILYNFDVTILTPPKELWGKWFYGKAISGKWKGKVRGQPLIAFPCWYTREAKVKALENYYKHDAKCVYVGIAFDEQKRIKSDPFVKYPLNDWKWTELDCAKYLKKLGLWNKLYDDFDRLGCYHCQKQSEWSLYMLWKKYPKEWESAKHWDNESMRVSEHGIKLKPLLDYQKEFEGGKIPKRKHNFVKQVNAPTLNDFCEDGKCDAVATAFQIRSKKLEEYSRRVKEI